MSDSVISRKNKRKTCRVDFLFKTLTTPFEFWWKLFKWIKILYTNLVFRIKNNGWISRTCKMTGGIKQGCPTSALLFIFVTEMLDNNHLLMYIFPLGRAC